ncbi:hypothetical protein GH714_042720 [Hevea brasiliensis]|uniref:Uncharacterized protein n=1 Tax=Hevea brasiliensis TaxID=3981 RepID=A0A6A6K1E0_HEVBR|nr:hypothetical protein GH714_042720 [Hevea brasiliensis]
MYRGKPLKSDVIEPPKSRSPQGNNGVHAHNMARRCFSNDDIGGASRNRAQSPRGTAARSASVNSAKRSVASTNGISANSAGSTGIRGMRLCEIRSARMEAKIAKPVVRSGKPSKVSTPTPGQASKQNGQLLRVSSAKPAEQGGERAPDVLGSPEPTQANGKVSTPAPEQASKQNGQLSRVPASPAEQGGERALDVLGSLEPTQANGKVSTPAPEQASKQNGQLSRVPDAESGEQNAALDTSARNVQSGSGGDSNPPPEGSASPEARVTLDGSYCNKLLETEPFGNPYKLAAVLADNIQECSRVDVSPSTVYSLFCNPLLSELIGDSYIPGVLRPKVTRTGELPTTECRTQGSGYMAEHYNALLSNIIAYQCVKAGCPSGPETRDMLEKIGRNTLQHLMPLLCFSTALTSVAAQLYNATNKEDLVHAMSADSARFIMESHSFRSTLVGDVAATLRKVMPPLEVHTRYNQENLEKIAAAIFIFYPGCNFDGSDIVLGRDGLKLLNVGEGKIRTSHDFFNEEEVSRIVQRPDILLSELQMLFWGFRLSLAR